MQLAITYVVIASHVDDLVVTSAKEIFERLSASVAGRLNVIIITTTVGTAPRPQDSLVMANDANYPHLPNQLGTLVDVSVEAHRLWLRSFARRVSLPSANVVRGPLDVLATSVSLAPTDRQPVASPLRFYRNIELEKTPTTKSEVHVHISSSSGGGSDECKYCHKHRPKKSQKEEQSTATKHKPEPAPKIGHKPSLEERIRTCSEVDRRIASHPRAWSHVRLVPVEREEERPEKGKSHRVPVGKERDRLSQRPKNETPVEKELGRPPKRPSHEDPVEKERGRPLERSSDEPPTKRAKPPSPPSPPKWLYMERKTRPSVPRTELKAREPTDPREFYSRIRPSQERSPSKFRRVARGVAQEFEHRYRSPAPRKDLHAERARYERSSGNDEDDAPRPPRRQVRFVPGTNGTRQRVAEEQSDHKQEKRDQHEFEKRKEEAQHTVHEGGKAFETYDGHRSGDYAPDETQLRDKTIRASYRHVYPPAKSDQPAYRPSEDERRRMRNTEIPLRRKVFDRSSTGLDRAYPQRRRSYSDQLNTAIRRRYGEMPLRQKALNRSSSEQHGAFPQRRRYYSDGLVHSILRRNTEIPLRKKVLERSSSEAYRPDSRRGRRPRYSSDGAGYATRPQRTEIPLRRKVLDRSSSKQHGAYPQRRRYYSSGLDDATSLRSARPLGYDRSYVPHQQQRLRPGRNRTKQRQYPSIVDAEPHNSYSRSTKSFRPDEADYSRSDRLARLKSRPYEHRRPYQRSNAIDVDDASRHGGVREIRDFAYKPGVSRKAKAPRYTDPLSRRAYRLPGDEHFKPRYGRSSYPRARRFSESDMRTMPKATKQQYETLWRPHRYSESDARKISKATMRQYEALRQPERYSRRPHRYSRRSQGPERDSEYGIHSSRVREPQYGRSHHVRSSRLQLPDHSRDDHLHSSRLREANVGRDQRLRSSRIQEADVSRDHRLHSNRVREAAFGRSHHLKSSRARESEMDHRRKARSYAPLAAAAPMVAGLTAARVAELKKNGSLKARQYRRHHHRPHESLYYSDPVEYSTRAVYKDNDNSYSPRRHSAPTTREYDSYYYDDLESEPRHRPRGYQSYYRDKHPQRRHEYIYEDEQSPHRHEYYHWAEQPPQRHTYYYADDYDDIGSVTVTDSRSISSEGTWEAEDRDVEVDFSVSEGSVSSESSRVWTIRDDAEDEEDEELSRSISSSSLSWSESESGTFDEDGGYGYRYGYDGYDGGSGSPSDSESESESESVGSRDEYYETERESSSLSDDDYGSGSESEYSSIGSVVRYHRRYDDEDEDEPTSSSSYEDRRRDYHRRGSSDEDDEDEDSSSSSSSSSGSSVTLREGVDYERGGYDGYDDDDESEGSESLEDSYSFSSRSSSSSSSLEGARRRTTDW